MRTKRGFHGLAQFHAPNGIPKLLWPSSHTNGTSRGPSSQHVRAALDCCQVCARETLSKLGFPYQKFMMPPLPRVLGFVGPAWYTFYPILSLTGKRLWQSSRLRQQSSRSGNRNISCLLAYIAFHLNKTRCSMFRLPQFYIQYLRQPLDTLQIVYSRVSIPDLSV